MIGKEASQSYYSRKLLQTNSSSSSFDTSQPSFIALLCVVSILTTAFVITVIILCYRYYSHRERKANIRHKRRNKLQRILSAQNNQQLAVPVSVTPTSASSYSVRSCEHLFSNQHHQPSSINTLPSCRLEQSILDAYLNDLNSFQPRIMDVNKLNSYLFIDLHSTSSETFPENISKQFTNKTMINSDNISTEDENLRKPRYYLKHQRQRRTTLTSKQIQNSRFLIRERSLPNNLSELPQLRQVVTKQQRRLFGLDDTNNSSMTIMNPDIQSSILSTTTDDYNDSHAYHVNQKQIMHTIKEEKPFIVHRGPSLHHKEEPYFFEVVSTSRDDYNDMQIPYRSPPIMGNRTAYVDDSIIV